MSNLLLTIGANVTDLHTKMELARADVRGFNTEVRDLTNQMATASDEMQGGLLAKLETAVSSLSSAKSHVTDLRKEMDDLTPATEHAGGAFVSLRETTEGINARLTETKALASGVGELFLAGLGGEKLLELGEKTAEFGEKMEIASHETGLSTAALQGLSFAANRQSVEFDTLERGIAKMAQTTQQAIAGGKQQTAVFQALGITTEELREHGDNAQYMLERVAGAIDRYGDGLNKETLVTDVFGAKMRDLGPVLSEIASGGIQGLINKNAELGGQFSGEFVEAAAKAETAMKDFKQESQNLGIELGSHLLPIITSVEEALNKFFTAPHDLQVQTVENLDMQLAVANDRLLQLGTTGKAWWEGRWFESDSKAIQDEVQWIDKLKTELALVRGEQALSGPPMTVQNIEVPDGLKLKAPNVGDIENEIARQKHAKEQEYQDAIAALQAEAAQYTSYSDQRIAILQQEATIAKTTWGEQSKQYQGVQAQIAAAQREQSQHSEQLLVEDTQAFIRAQDQQLTAFIEHDQQLVAQKKLTIEDAAAQEAKLTQEIYAQELKRLDLDIVLAGDDLAVAQKLSDQKLALAEKETIQLEKIYDKAATERERKEEATDKAIAKSGASTITGLITGQTTLAQARDALLTKGLENIIEYGLLESAKWIGFESIKTAASQAGVFGRIALAALGETETVTTQGVGASAEVTSAAAVAGANAFASTAAIPYIGPALAPAAGIAAETAVLSTYLPQASLDVGTAFVPQDMDARIHKGEIVVPAAFSDSVRAGNLTLGGGAGGDIHIHMPAGAIQVTGRVSAHDLVNLEDAVTDVFARAAKMAQRKGTFRSAQR